jgi:drug/metabolite transporter (DMT)-like permease
MIGIVIAALAGVILSFVDAGKKVLSTKFAPEVVILLMNTFGVICNLTYFAIVGFPSVDWEQILLPFLLCGALGIFGEIFILKALTLSDFSLTMPLFALIPVFGALFGFVLFSEVPSLGAGIGVILVVFGTYLLGMSQTPMQNWLSPLSSILRNSGCRYMIAFTLFCAAGCVGQRYGSRYSSPLFFFTLTLLLNWVVFFSLVLLRKIKFISTVKENRILIFSTGIFWALGVALMFLSYNLTLAAYAGSTLQLGTVVSIVIGAVFFKEKYFLERMRAGLIMLVGVAMVAVYS